MVQDLATQWIQYCPCKNKNSQETEKSLRKFFEPSHNPTVVHTDNSLEFGKSCEESSWNHRTSTPHRSETNGIAERAVRRVKEGTSAVSLQSGLDKKRWSDSMECFWYLRRFGESFLGPNITLGAMVEYLPNSERDRARNHQFGKEVLPGIVFRICFDRGEEFGKEIL